MKRDTVLITGASRGIGSAIAKSLAKENYNIVINFRENEIEAKKVFDEIKEYNSNYFINELFMASKSLGILEEKIKSYKFDNILMPLLNTKEAISSMYLEGTQTTMSAVLEDVINEDKEKKNEKIYKEATNHTKALHYGATYLSQNNFNHTFIK